MHDRSIADQHRRCVVGAFWRVFSAFKVGTIVMRSPFNMLVAAGSVILLAIVRSSAGAAEGALTV
jgi:hypothetical protein